MKIKQIKWHITKTDYAKPHSGAWVLIHIKKPYADWYTMAQWDSKYKMWCTKMSDYYYDKIDVVAWASIPKEV